MCPYMSFDNDMLNVSFLLDDIVKHIMLVVNGAHVIYCMLMPNT